MDHERRLICKAVHAGAAEKLIARGISTEHFLDEECRAVWETMSEHMRTYRASPSAQAVMSDHPGFNFEAVTDTLDYCIDEFVKRTSRRFGIQALEDIARAIDDPRRDDTVEELFLERANQLARAVPATRASRYSDMELRIDEYRRRKAAGEIRGILMGIPTFDNITLGIQPHEMLSIVGWQGTGKSTLLMWAVQEAYIQGRDPMIVSMEMEAEALWRKLDTAAAGFDYQALKSLNLSEEEEERWEAAAERAKSAANDIVIIDDLGKATPDRVYAEIMRYNPKLVGVDYISLMELPGRSADLPIWERVTQITKQLKLMARSLKVPVIAVAQTNIGGASDGAQLDNIAYSRSIGQDSDIVLGLHQNEEMLANKRMTIRMLKNRDGVRSKTDCYWNPAKMEFHEWTPADQFAAQKATP